MKHLRQYIRQIIIEMKQAGPTPGWGGSGWPGALPPRRVDKAWQRQYAKDGRPFWSKKDRVNIIDMEGNVHTIAYDGPGLKVKRTDLNTRDGIYTLTKGDFGGFNLEGGGYKRNFDDLDNVAEFLSGKKAIAIK